MAEKATKKEGVLARILKRVRGVTITKKKSAKVGKNTESQLEKLRKQGDL